MGLARGIDISAGDRCGHRTATAQVFWPIPNTSRNRNRPNGVTATARVPLTRRTHPCSRQCAHSAGGQRAGNMKAPFAPVQAGPAEDAPAPGRRGSTAASIQPDAKFAQERFALSGEGAALAGKIDVAARGHVVGDGDGQFACQVVVARPGVPQRLVLRPGGERGRGIRPHAVAFGGERHQAFQRAGHGRRGQAVITVTALPLDRQQAGDGQPGKMAAGRLRRNAGEPR